MTTLPPQNRIKDFFATPVRPYLYLALLVLMGCIAINFEFGYPLPKIHDEFSYLLSAETFSKGRLTNPPHPVWTFFETFQVIQQPSYQSKYPPGQGVQLAVGIWLGHPIHGVWLTLCLWAMALFWMLQGAGIPRHWSFLWSVIGIAQYGVFSYFGHSYWGGSLFGLAGTLVFGAALHARGDRFSIPTLINMGLGLLIMINTRPFEGLIFCVFPLLFFFVNIFKSENLNKSTKVLALSVVLIFVGVGIGLHGYYNKQVTGKWSVMPYSVYQKEYMPGYPQFVFEKAGDIKKSRHREFDVLQSLYTNSNRPLTPEQYVHYLVGNIENLFASFFPGIWLVAAFFSLLAAWKSTGMERRWGWGTLCTASVVIALSSSANRATWLHYFSAWLPVAVFILADGVQQSRKMVNDDKPLSNFLIMLVLAQFLLLCLLTFFSGTGYRTRTEADPLFVKNVIDQMQTDKAKGGDFRLPKKYIEQTLMDKTKEDGIKHVVMVRYGKNHQVHDEWVYNGADMDSQDVVWARWISDEDNKPLVEYYGNRNKWILDIEGPIGLNLTLYGKAVK
jgi:hypothetical protein